MEFDPHARIFSHINLKQMISNKRMKTDIDALGQYLNSEKSIRNDEQCYEDLDSMLCSVL